MFGIRVSVSVCVVRYDLDVNPAVSLQAHAQLDSDEATYHFCEIKQVNGTWFVALTAAKHHIKNVSSSISVPGYQKGVERGQVSGFFI